MRLTILGSSAAFPLPRTNTNRFDDYLNIETYAQHHKLHKDPLCKSARRGGNDRRTRSSIAIENNGKTILIDAGPDIRYQLKKYRVKPSAVFVTHDHFDASYGLRYLPLHIPIYAEHMGTLRPGRIIKIAGLSVRPFRVRHAKNVPCVGFEVRNGKKCIVYASDFSSLAGMKPYVKRADILFVDGSSLKQEIYTHLAINAQLKTYAKWKPRKVIFTHIGHGTLPYKELVQYIRGYYKPSAVAYDGLKLSL